MAEENPNVKKIESSVRNYIGGSIVEYAGLITGIAGVAEEDPFIIVIGGGAYSLGKIGTYFARKQQIEVSLNRLEETLLKGYQKKEE